MDNLIIRNARLSDLRSLHDAQRRTIRAFSTPFYETETLETFLGSGGLVAPLLVEGGGYRVGTRNDRIVAGAGWGEAAPCHPEVTPYADGWLRGVFVVPEDAGRGTARQLVNAVLSDLRTAGRERVDLLATLNAVPFYRRPGWRSVRAVSLPMDGMPEMATVWMTHGHPLEKTEAA
jgi:GNAT superfamily N-acetyltransferase